MTRFMIVCELINFPVLLEKSEWPTQVLIFLGIILNGKRFTIMVPEDKRLKALQTLERTCGRKKMKVKEIQQITGILNFLTKAIVPGRVFTRRMYATISQSVVQMVNNTNASCRNCMYLLRMLTLNNILYNRMIKVEYISTKDNFLADNLSRLRIKSFLSKAPRGTALQPTLLPEELWPLTRIWQE